MGKTYITPLVTKGVPLGVFLRQAVKPGVEKLTARQREVLQLLAEGRAMKEIADLLHVTPRTVAFHKYSIMEHLGLEDERRTGTICPRAWNVEKSATSVRASTVSFDSIGDF